MNTTRVGVRVGARYLGQSGESGKFRADDGREVEYSDAHLFHHRTPEGLSSTIQIRADQIDEAADFNIADLDELSPVVIEGVCVIGGTNPGRLVPSSITRVDTATGEVKPAPKAKAA